MASGTAETVTGMASVAQYAFLISAFLTIIGWFVVANQNDKRERRRDIKEHISELRQRCINIRLHSTEYWLGATGTSRKLSAENLKAEINSLSRLSNTVATAGLKFESGELVANVRSIATGGKFEVKGRRRSIEDEIRVSDVGIAIEDFLGAIEESYYAQFPIQKPKKWLAVFLPIGAIFTFSSDSQTP